MAEILLFQYFFLIASVLKLCTVCFSRLTSLASRKRCRWLSLECSVSLQGLLLFGYQRHYSVPCLKPWSRRKPGKKTTGFTAVEDLDPSGLTGTRVRQKVKNTSYAVWKLMPDRWHNQTILQTAPINTQKHLQPHYILRETVVK